MSKSEIKNEMRMRDLLSEFGFDPMERDNEQIVCAILLLLKEIREIKEILKK